MNTHCLRQALFAAAATAAFIGTSAFAGSTTTLRVPLPKTYDHTAGGGSLSWFDPANWSPYGVPGPEDDVVLDGDDYVVIDAALNRAGAYVQFRDLYVRDAAIFEAKNGATVENRYETVQNGGQVIYRSSGQVGESAVFGGASDPMAAVPPVSEIVVTKFNPTPHTKRTVVLIGSASMDMGLGGTEAAGIIKTGTDAPILNAGRGHYSTLVVDTLVVEGELRLSTYYGFEPKPGDTFQLITVNGSRSGEFIGIPEGGYVGCTDRTTCLRLSYRGGDGNDIVLTAETVNLAIALLLPAVQRIADEVDEAATKLPPPTTPISAPPPPPK